MATTMATDDDDNNNGDGATGNEVDNDGYGARCDNNDDNNGKNINHGNGERKGFSGVN